LKTLYLFLLLVYLSLTILTRPLCKLIPVEEKTVKQRILFLACFLGVISAGGAVRAAAQGNAYQQTNLVSNVPKAATHTDRNLVNPWGIAFIPGQPFFLADNARGVVRTYNAAGVEELPGLFGVLPPAGDTTPSKPSGIVGNFTADFVLDGAASQFLVATEDGTISGWASVDSDFPTFAALAVDNSKQGAVYKGIAVLTPYCCAPFLVVTNFNSGFIEPYTSFFVPLAPPGSFTDPTLPKGYAPFGIQVVEDQVFVTYALQDAKKHDPVVGAGRGIVSIFDLEGNFVKRFVTHGRLNAPWGVAKASAKFGLFSNDILIGNFGDGTISAFDPLTGQFLGRLKDETGKVIVNAGLRGLAFAASPTGHPNTLYFTAGPKQGQDGVFGSITVVN